MENNAVHMMNINFQFVIIIIRKLQFPHESAQMFFAATTFNEASVDV